MNHDEVGPRFAGGRTAVRGRFATYMRECEASHRLIDADLLRGGAASRSAKNLSDYLNGRSFPADHRSFVQLVDAFRNVGEGLFHQEIRRAEMLWFEEAPAWDRYTAGQIGWVSESGTEPLTRANRSTRARRKKGSKKYEQIA